jgi:hypothetical protein
LLTCKEVEDENDDEDENDWGSGGRELRPTIERHRPKSNEREFDAINVKFFVIKKGLH